MNFSRKMIDSPMSQAGVDDLLKHASLVDCPFCRKFVTLIKLEVKGIVDLLTVYCLPDILSKVEVLSRRK